MESVEAKGGFTVLYWYSTTGFVFLLFFSDKFKKLSICKIGKIRGTEEPSPCFRVSKTTIF
jgi:hypothetical protein